MKTIFFTTYLLSRVISICIGFPDLPFYPDVPTCSSRLDEIDSTPFYEFEEPIQPFDKRSEVGLTSDKSSNVQEKWSGQNSVNADYTNVDDAAPAQVARKANASQWKNLEDEDESNAGIAKLEIEEPKQILATILKENHKRDTQTIQLPASFTPRLGRKRSDEQYGISRQGDSSTNRLSGRESITKFDEDIFASRFGRSEEPTRIVLNAGSAFSPRLGRSEDNNRIFLKAGNSFTPRFGRSEGPSTIYLNPGGSFRPRFGRSGGHKIVLNAGSSFKPRMGRSESPDRIHLNAGGAFKPRLGRSEEPNKILLNAGNAFKPRLGRSGESGEAQLSF